LIKNLTFYKGFIEMKQKTNRWVDLTLFTAFMATYFLDLTGVELHQWLGVASGVLALYHLMIHWDWVVAVSDRFLNRTSSKARLFYMIDAALLIGFELIVFTGLVISTWFNLTLGDYSTWLTVHIAASISTLSVLVVKLALHWRWISRMAQKIWTEPGMVSTGTLVRQPVRAGASRLDRREFLQVMGVVGMASAIAVLSASKGLADVGGTTAASDLTDASSSTSSTSASRSSGSTASSGCTVRCRRACSYPGHCQRYVDSNNNRLCDLGECT
jgi:hypothetical protein